MLDFELDWDIALEKQLTINPGFIPKLEVSH